MHGCQHGYGILCGVLLISLFAHRICVTPPLAISETFGLAYAGDSIVAIVAGQLAGAMAGARGPTGPFELSTGFLLAGGLLTSLLWKEKGPCRQWILKTVHLASWSFVLSSSPCRQAIQRDNNPQ